MGGGKGGAPQRPSAVCLHGHFYQPPREDPWLEAVPSQPDAAPYHDWNERVHAECYFPNAVARILDEEGRIVRLCNNYRSMGFDMGPTLLSWLERRGRETYEAILQADRESVARFQGHGSAMAQGYNHLIFPLADARDRRTQIRWGLEDFTHRFGRAAEGFWLPETAVDRETLEMLADEGVRFTVLAPSQLETIRRSGDEDFSPPKEGGAEREPYLADLPSGKRLALFFYDSSLSHAVAFEGLLRSGRDYVDRIYAKCRNGSAPGLVAVATDGESYGHHHRFGEMALAYTLDRLERENKVDLVNFGSYLEMSPPRAVARVKENSSWSCAHGVERWRSDCGCRLSSGSQDWRGPLREAFDWLRDEVRPAFERLVGDQVADPWEARNDYIKVILDRSLGSVDAYLQSHCRRRLCHEEKVRLLRLMECQRNAMLMYTSCGWFFDDVAGIETVQNLRYAARVIELHRLVTGDDLEERFLALLGLARSNDPKKGDARKVFEDEVKPRLVGLKDIARHHAVTYFLGRDGIDLSLYCYRSRVDTVARAVQDDREVQKGVIEVSSGLTLAEARFSFIAFRDTEARAQVAVIPASGGSKEAVRKAIERAGEEARWESELREALEHEIVSLDAVLPEVRRHLLDREASEMRASAVLALDHLSEKFRASLRRFRDAQLPPPPLVSRLVEIGIESAVLDAVKQATPGVGELRHLFLEAEELGVTLDSSIVEEALRQLVRSLARSLRRNPLDQPILEAVQDAVALVHEREIEIDLLPVQIALFKIAACVREGWPEGMKALGERLRLVLPQPDQPAGKSDDQSDAP